MTRARRFRVSQCHLFTISMAVLFGVSVFLGQEQAQTSTPDGIIHAAIDAIEHNYLLAKANPLWNISRDKLLKGNYKDSSQAFQAIQQQLPYMEDSELNLLTPDEIKAVQSEATGEKIGLGLDDFCIDMQLESGRPRVVTPIAGSPAMKAGIESGDIIVSINGKATSDLAHEQVMDALRVPSPGGVKLQIDRGGRTLRSSLQPDSDKLDVLRFEAKKASGKKVGYIRIAMFTPDVAQKAHEAITALEQEGVDGYVLDLRNNPGGFLNSARDIAGLFVTGTLGFKLHSNEQKETMEAKGTPVTKRPLAVLINRGSASAAEFLSGALQGLHRATLVGVHSYGRGRGQTFVPLAEGYGIQIPTVELLTPNEQEFRGKGIVPDVEVKQPQLQENQLTGPRDRQFITAVAKLQK